MATAKNSNSNPSNASATLDDILGEATPAERVVPICIKGHLIAEHEQLEEQLAAAQQADAGSDRLASGGSALPIARKIEALQEEMRTHTHTFRFQAISPKAWSDLMAAHPDPQGKKAFDPDGFLPAAIAACCVEPAGIKDDPEKAQALLAKLSSSQQNDLFDGAWSVNMTSPKEPHSYTASAVLRSSAKNSPTPPQSASPGRSS